MALMSPLCPLVGGSAVIMIKTLYADTIYIDYTAPILLAIPVDKMKGTKVQTLGARARAVAGACMVSCRHNNYGHG